MTTNDPLTVRDLIRALERLPGDTRLACFAWDQHEPHLFTADDHDEFGLSVVTWHDGTYLATEYDRGMLGTPLDFAPNDAEAGATPQQDPLLSEDELTYVEKQAAQWAGLTDEEYLAKRREIYARSTFKAGDKVILPDGDTCTITRYLGGGTWAFICGDGKERFAFDYMMRRSESTPTA